MITRRRLIAAAALWPIAPAAFGQTKPLTCGQVTPRQTEGPFFKTNTPQRITLIEPGSKAPRLVVTGQVLSRECTPLKGALLDFWHADEHGDYDNRAFRYRGHQFTDADGRWRLETILPAVYPGRTRHIHVKVQRPHGRILTTQLYFPGEPRNRTDSIFDSSLLMDIRRAGSGRRAQFRFVLR